MAIMRLTSIVIAAVAMTALAANQPLLAGPLEEAQASMRSGDYSNAFAKLRPLAIAGNPQAQIALGIMYNQGRGVVQDYAQAVFWYRKAAEQGDASAQYFLGAMYDNGQGVTQDYAQAVFWYRKAAEQGHGSAQSNLGIMYLRGQGVTQDYVQAHKWFNLAGARLADADRRKKAVFNRDLAAAKMTPAQIAEAQRLASIWKPR